MPPSLSIVIPSHSQTELLRACLASVQTYAPAGVEILVVDDGSRDARVSRVAESFDGVRVLRLPRRRGFCVAANAGVAASRGAIVELLNDDTEVTAGWAAAALAVFGDERVAAVAPLVLRGRRDTRGGTRIDSAGDRYYLGGVAGKRGHNRPLEPAFLQPCRVFGASASSAFYRRAAFLAVGGFPEHFGAYFEDVDLSFRLNQAGYEVRYEPTSRVRHHGGASYGRTRRSVLEQQSRNEELVFWRNIPARAWPAAVPRHLAVLAGKAWKRWQEGGLAPFLSGRLRALAEVRWRNRHVSNGATADWLVERTYW